MMFNKWNLNQKLFGGFGTVFTFLLILALSSIFGLKGTLNNAKEVIKGNNVRGNIIGKHVDHLKWSMKVGEFLLDDNINDLKIQTDPGKCAFGKWYYSEERKRAEDFLPKLKSSFKEIEKFHIDLHESAIEIIEIYKTSKKDAQDIYVNKTIPALVNVERLLTEIVELTSNNVISDDLMIKTAERTNLIIILISVIALIVGITLVIFIALGISRAINNVTQDIDSGAEQVAAASDQLASSSQQMAQGASEQASSLEEISSSIEELTSMTKQNADNSYQANEMGKNANSAGSQSKKAVGKMSETVVAIKKSSDKTAQIIKTIDEIAMQTNLLALNAAVEAARAGEAGRGFAVVAEEVRSLAQRSAEAAKSTADLIEGMQKSSEEGVSASEEVEKSINEISEAVEKMTGLLSEVSTASGEQAQGLDQISSAVSQLDKVTQSNAANSEQSASASEELSAQAQGLNMAVRELKNIVGSKVNGLQSIGNNSFHNNREIDRRSEIHNSDRQPSSMKKREVQPDELISFDNDKELEDF